MNKNFTKQALFGLGTKPKKQKPANTWNDRKSQLIREIIAKRLGLNSKDINDAATWDELGAGELDKLDSAMALQDAFNKELPFAFTNTRTIGDAIALMKNQENMQPKQASYKKATMNFNTIYNSMKKQALDGSVVPGNPGKPAGLGALGKALRGKLPGLASSAALSGAPTVGAAALGKLPPAKTTTPTAPTEGAVPAAGAGPMNVPPAGATDAAQGQAPETFSEAVNAWTKYEKAKNPQAQVASTQPNTQPTQTPAEAPMMQQPVSPLAKGASLDKRAQLQQMLDAWRAHRVRK